MRGGLLLAEALLEQKEYRAAEAALGRLAEGDLIPELKWHRQYLLCRVQLAGQRLPEAWRTRPICWRWRSLLREDPAGGVGGHAGRNPGPIG